MTKPLFIVGTRPEIIKISSLVNGIDSNVLFTGQHFDIEMSEFFFKLIKSAPLINLNGRNYQDKNWGSFTNDIKSQIKKINPSSVVVQGDTNTTLYGAVAAKSSGVKINYIESGMRSGDITQVEEFNRIIVAGLADKNFCNHKNNQKALTDEGVNLSKTMVSGSTVYSVLESNNLLKKELQNKGKFILLTLHRPENVDNSKKLNKLLNTIDSLGVNIKFITHPRVFKPEKYELLKPFKNIEAIKPKEYFSFIKLIKESLFVISDSGGIQEESAILGKPLLIPRNFTERPEMLSIFNLLVDKEKSLKEESRNLINGVSKIQKIDESKLLYGKSEVVDLILNNII
tara:strand:+ start:62 stop:1090 length:1029 start_codon:yes stop_codon:yes gene_type:complete